MLGVLPANRVAGMLSMLPLEIQQRLDEYQAALRDENLDRARRAAHTLKWLAANFGASQLMSVSYKAEAACGETLAMAHAALPPMQVVAQRTAEAAIKLSAEFRVSR